jgi:dTDP-glucose 4,6-dehydratase
MATSLQGKRIAVLGSNSFAGASLIKRLLDDGADVIGFNRSPEGSAPVFLQYRWAAAPGCYRFIKADINHDLDSVIETLREFGPSIVADFAGQGMVAESWQNPDQWYTTNIVAKVRLHDALRKLEGLERYIRVSTPEVYGSNETLLKETWSFNPSTPYAVSHAAIDMSLRAFHQRYGFPVVFTRFANFYGPGQQLYRIIPRTIIYALLNRKLQLHGGGKAVRAFIYGSDVADGIVRCMTNGEPGEIYHFSPEDFHTIRDVVTSIINHLNMDFDSLVEVAPDRPSKDQAYLMDSSRARTELGWVPNVDLQRGIAKTAEWIAANLAEIKTLPLDYIHKA